MPKPIKEREPRRAMVQVGLTPKDRDRIQTLADLDGRTVADLARRWLLAATKEAEQKQKIRA